MRDKKTRRSLNIVLSNQKPGGGFMAVTVITGKKRQPLC
tara:strand:- start:46 stop:162 length:117 start_codon:yes stop_codon:yes gene_type:complete